MRKLLSIFALVFCASSLFAQKTMMHIRLSDASVQPIVANGQISVDASQVDGISFEVAPLPLGLEPVDLGLTSGLLWANMNFGADKAESPGDLYTAQGQSGALPTLDDNEDIVSLTWGKPYGERWRMPSSFEVQELLDECDWEWDGKGYKVKSRQNGAFIYLPVTQVWRNGALEEPQTGNYWTSDVVDDADESQYLSFTPSSHEMKAITSALKSCGLAIRPVYGDATTGNYKRPKAVDLGLSVKWSSYNLGAESEYEVGGYYGWGDRTGELTENVPGHYGVREVVENIRIEVLPNYDHTRYYTIDTEEWVDTSAGKVETETDGSGKTHYYYVETRSIKTLLYSENIAGRDSFDVATAQLGGKWRMPSRAEINELKQCRWEFVSDYGPNRLKGYKVYGIGDYAANYIFIPYAGYRRVANYFDVGVHACWWSSENDASAQAYYFYVAPSMSELTGAKSLGLTIRPVYPVDGGNVNPGADKTWTYTTGEEGLIPDDGVDLGLSVKWANWNLGATSTTGNGSIGNYYAWGELKTKSTFTLDNYSIDEAYLNVKDKPLDDAHDAAQSLWGGQWFMPTEDQFGELRDNCDITLETREGVTGYLFTSQINGKSIFLPAAGYKNGTMVYYVNAEGNYWNRTDWFTSNDEKARTWGSSLFFTTVYVPTISGNPRNWGLSIRPVMKK